MNIRQAIFFLVLFTNVALAESDILLFSSETQSQSTLCRDEAAYLNKVLALYPHPTSWTYVIACDEAAWAKTLAHIGLNERAGKRYGETDIDPKEHVTYLRGWVFLHPDSEEITGEHVIVHELCHITLDSRDERKVELRALAMMKEKKDKARLALASTY